MANNQIYKNLILNDNENLIKTLRQSRLNLLLVLILPSIIIALPFFFLYFLFSNGTVGIVVFTLILLGGLFWLTKNITIWYFKIFIVTDQRIIDVDQIGLFQKTVSNIPLTKIQDVFFQIKGIWQTLTRVGDITIVLIDSKTKIEIENIFQPQKNQQLILELKADTLKEKLESTQLSAQELVDLIKKIKAGIGEKKFNKILEKDKNLLEDL